MHRIHQSKGVVLTLAVTGLALAGCADSSPKHEFVHPAHVEHHDGSDLAHVTLTARAAERTGVEVATVADAPVTRKRTFQGEVVSSGSGLGIKVTSRGETPADKTATIRPLVQGAGSWTAHQVGAPSPGSGELRFSVDDPEGLVAGQRVGVELALSTTHRRVVPYSSVIYDEHGNTWVYTSPEHLNYVRAPITIDYIEGDVAVLKDGPPAGTKVVSVGAIEIYGTEFEVGH
jgi:multidrug efflux pump subunit AcrA (membrane-fusion protein)